MLTLRIKEKFDQVHYLNDYDGDCSRTHGHTWKVEVYILTTGIKDNGITMDFKEVKKIVKSVLPDHQFLNKIYKFNPTAENISGHIYNQLKKLGLNVQKVVLWETDKNAVEYIEHQ